ncbi:odorant receptor 94b-like [Colletes latitarsis]|uniref:odorant receptor 94b-like n=1 Tax=Colletes latitarsis TaxID=2605962 RepID=UPI004035E08F
MTILRRTFRILTTLVLSLVLDIVFNVENQDEFSDNFYVTLAPFIACCKMCNFLINRSNIAALIDNLRREPFAPANAEEIEILTRYDKIIEWNTMAYTVLIESCIVWIWVTSFFTDLKCKKLVYRAWLPYDYSSSFLYAVTYAQQVVGITICSLLSVAYDTLYSGMLIHTYCQLEILGHRLKRVVKDDNDSVKLCARHHRSIYQLVSQFLFELETHEKPSTCTQLLVSTSIVCFNLYRLTQSDLGSRMFETVFYGICMLTEIFYYCWYGNEVKLKSLEVSNMIMEGDWTSLNVKSKKILLMIMRRATMPIEFKSIHVVSMDLESFMMLLKTSYSAYNMLQQSKE